MSFHKTEIAPLLIQRAATLNKHAVFLLTGLIKRSSTSAYSEVSFSPANIADGDILSAQFSPVVTAIENRDAGMFVFRRGILGLTQSR